MTPTKLPRALKHQSDLGRPGQFQVVDHDGVVWADGIRNELAASLFAASPEILAGYDWMMAELVAYFYLRWDIGHHGPDLQELIDDEGDLEARYPGAPAQAVWIQHLRERSNALRGSDGESPFQPYVDPQGNLF